jgi:hypothetical protein
MTTIGTILPIRRRPIDADNTPPVCGIHDPKWTFAFNMMIARHAESETSSPRVRLVLYASVSPQATAHRASSLSRVLASFRSSVSKPSVNQP